MSTTPVSPREDPNRVIRPGSADPAPTATPVASTPEARAEQTARRAAARNADPILNPSPNPSLNFSPSYTLSAKPDRVSRRGWTTT